MNSRIQEIQQYLDYKDYPLAIRRMLDYSYDTANPTTLRKAINWSAYYREQVKHDANAEPNFLAQANALLNELQATQIVTNTGSQLLLSANDVAKQYGRGNFSLKPISLSISTNDILGVVGENGNGKTTLLRLLAGQLSIDQGEIDYHNINSNDFYNIKHHVAFIPQCIPRWYGQLKDNLHFSAALSGIKGAENELMVDFMLERLGLMEFAHLNWTQISSGYRTRFEVARILLQKPHLLILDEPLANLDINAQQTLLTDLRYLAKSSHHPMGVILTSQQLHEVEKIADNVMLIKQGVCTYRTADVQDKTKAQSFVLEIESASTREALASALPQEVSVSYNGGLYTITSTSTSVAEIVKSLLNNEIEMSYFRDITHSTKRFF